jgi:hypothetical protein
MTIEQLREACKNRSAQIAMNAANLTNVLQFGSESHKAATVLMNSSYEEYFRISKLIREGK